MRHGDKDGFKDIYDAQGGLLIHPNERKLVTEENVVPSLKSTWRYYGGEYLLEPSKGTIYLTNERMVFINIPERMFAIGGGEESRAMATPVGANFEIGDMTPGAAVREYFEIPNIEIMASEKKEGVVSLGQMVNIYILSSGNQFHLSMVLPADSDLMKRLMNKQVGSLDELVNNLKDYFKRTEWMFTEAERRLYVETKKEEEASKPYPEPSPGVGAPQTEASKQAAPSQGQRPSAPQPPPISRMYKAGAKVENQSLNYFESLYKKGMIKEDIYKRLLAQYGATSPDGSRDSPSTTSAGGSQLSETSKGQQAPAETRPSEEGMIEAEPLDETGERPAGPTEAKAPANIVPLVVQVPEQPSTAKADAARSGPVQNEQAGKDDQRKKVRMVKKVAKHA